MSPRKLVFGLAWALAASSGQAQITAKLNDTGVVICANAESNVVGCSYPDSDTAGFPRQDGQIGRSAKEEVKGFGPATAQLPKTGASWSKGFDFTKVQYLSPYTTLAATATQGVTGTGWGCTKDNVTGLIWETKTAPFTSGTFNVADVRMGSSLYTWNMISGNYGGDVGFSGVAASNARSTTAQCYDNVAGAPGNTCDTQQYIALINSLNICGETADDWRLPTRSELLGLADNTPGRLEFIKSGVTGTSGASVITVPDTSGLVAGMTVAGDNINLATVIVSIAGTAVTVSHPNSAAVSGNVTFKHIAAVDPTYFPHMRIGNYYWTSDSNPDNPAEARFVNFAYGADGVTAKGDTLHVILVRP